eukprot:1161075-Pelagomonas_calceolata.AAC.15
MEFAWSHSAMTQMPSMISKVIRTSLTLHPPQVVGTNAMKRKQGIEDTASRAFQTWQQPQAQTGVPEAPKLAPAMPKAWKQQGSRCGSFMLFALIQQKTF